MQNQKTAFSDRLNGAGMLRTVSEEMQDLHELVDGCSIQKNMDWIFH